MSTTTIKCTISVGDSEQTVYLPLPSGFTGISHTLRYDGTPITSYQVGDTLDISGLRFYITSEDGEEFEISNPAEDLVISADMNTPGEQEVKIAYGATCSYTITISDPTPVPGLEILDLHIQTLPSKLDYLVGDTLDLDGMVAVLRYRNSDTITVLPTDQLVVSGFDSSVAVKTQTVTVSYTYEDGVYTDTFNISISSSGSDEDIVSIVASVDDTYYYVHEKLVKTDVKVVGTTRAGNEVTIPSENCVFTGYDSSTATTKQTVTVTYTPLSTPLTSQFVISINDHRDSLIGFRINQIPTKVVYTKGSTVVDLSGGKFSARYRLSSNDSKWIPIQKAYVTAVLGDTSRYTDPEEYIDVTVSYGSFSQTYPVSVHAEEE